MVSKVSIISAMWTIVMANYCCSNALHKSNGRRILGGELQLFVNSPGQPLEKICVEVSSKATVSDLREEIVSYGIELGRLSIGGKELPTEGALGDIGVCAEATVQNHVDEPVVFEAKIWKDGRWCSRRIACYGIMGADVTTEEIEKKIRKSMRGVFDDDLFGQTIEIRAHISEELNVVIDYVYAGYLATSYASISITGPDGNAAYQKRLCKVKAHALQLLLSGNGVVNIRDLEIHGPGRW